MHHATSAYAKVARAIQSPRELEASLLTRAAQRLQALSENWIPDTPELGAALTFNRRIWTILAASATAPDHPLPAPVKANIAQLAAFIFQRTVSVLAEPAPERLAVLVQINRDIASGLRSVPAPASAAEAAG